MQLKYWGCMHNYKNINYLLGQKINQLTILEIVQGSPKKLKCLCVCGQIKNISLYFVINNITKSCGCLQKQKARLAFYKHGKSNTREYRIWIKIKGRCMSKTNDRYKDYGGRGITVCHRWLDSFENFLKDMGYAPSNKHSIDRINNNGNYCKENCRWATPKEQLNNTRYNRVITHNDITLTVSEWASKLKMQRVTLMQRINAKWKMEDIINTPVKIYKARNTKNLF